MGWGSTVMAKTLLHQCWVIPKAPTPAQVSVVSLASAFLLLAQAPRLLPGGSGKNRTVHAYRSFQFKKKRKKRQRKKKRRCNSSLYLWSFRASCSSANLFLAIANSSTILADSSYPASCILCPSNIVFASYTS